MENNKTDRELIQEKNYSELYLRYEAKIYKESFKMSKDLQEEFRQEAFFAVVKAVDRADLSRDFQSFNTLLHYSLLDLRTSTIKSIVKTNSIEGPSFDESVSLEESDTSKSDLIQSSLFRKEDSFNYSPEVYMYEDKERALEKTYYTYLGKLSPFHRQLLDLKMSGKTREEIAKAMGIKMSQLSCFTGHLKKSASLAFDVDYANSGKSDVAYHMPNFRNV